MRVAALILAKGNSVRVRNKNARLCGGKRLIEWPLEAARESKYIQETFVSTDGAEIKRIALDSGAYVIDRPDQLALPTAGDGSTLAHAIREIQKTGFKYDWMFRLCATSPLVQTWQLDDAFEKFIASNYARHLSSVSWMKSSIVDNLYIKDPNDNRLVNLFGLQGPPAYMRLLPFCRANGAFAIFNPNLVDLTKLPEIETDTDLAELEVTYGIPGASWNCETFAIKQHLVYGYEIDWISALDINTEDDLALADHYLRQRRIKQP